MTMTRLGPYEIIGPLGAGGMGEVYRARDTRLDRDVAIKVSATEFSERFAREARSIAALNHSNICHLYDVGPDYLVLEYVEGVHPAGPMTFDDALPIIRQLIDGIEAAHDANIIHRDLKAANIKITSGPGGKWKISTAGGKFPAWSRTTRELFWLGGDDRIMVVDYSVQGDTFSAGRPRVWSTTPIRRDGVRQNFDMSADGTRAVVFPAAAENDRGTLHATFLLNFFDDVRRRIPQ